MKFLKRLFKSKKYVNLKLEIEEGQYHEELVDISKVNERVEELQNHYFLRKDPDKVESIWCLVGNIIDEHYFGEEKEIRRGTKHFPPGAKVYCFPAKWGDGYEQILVIGRPRKSKRFIMVILNSNLVRNWRLMRVYSPFIKKKMLENGGWDDSEKSKETIEEMLKWLPERSSKIA